MFAVFDVLGDAWGKESVDFGRLNLDDQRISQINQ